MTELRYPIVVQALSQEDGGGYLAFALDLRGCVGDGETPEQAISDLALAINEWVAECQRLERPVPEPGSLSLHFEKEQQQFKQYLQKQSELVETQRALIKNQDEMLRLREVEIEQIREKLESLQNSDDRGSNYSIEWLSVKPTVAALEMAKRSRSGGAAH
jgi:antitoxin HicB